MLLMLVMLRAMLRKDVWETNRAALTEDVLTNNDVKTLVKYIGELHDCRFGDVSVNDVIALLDAKYRRPGGRKQELLDLVQQMAAQEDRPFEEVQPMIADFLSRELAMQAATYIAARDNTDKFDIIRPLELLTRASELASGVDLDVEDIADAPPPGEHDKREAVATIGLGSAMDAHLAGGLGMGEMLIWLAPPGTGKTSMLINQCVEHAKAGEHVLHITLEINKNKCRQRIDQALTGLTREERLGRPELIVARRRALAGTLMVKDWCHRNVMVDDIRNLVRTMRAQGKSVTTVSLDYLGLMSAVRQNKNGRRFDYSDIAKDLRKLGNELGVKMITAWQVNRSGSAKHVVGGEDVAECWDIVMHADIILGLNQNTQERESKTLRINIIKQRESTARPIEYYYCDLDRMVIKQNGEGDADEPPDEVGAGNRSGVRQYRLGAAPG